MREEDPPVSTSANDSPTLRDDSVWGDSPPSHASHKPKRASRNLQISRCNRMAVGKMPVAGGQRDEEKEKSQENGNEDKIRPEGADEVYQA